MSRKLPLNIRNFNGIVDQDLAEHNAELDNYLAATTNASASQLDKFLSRPEFIAGQADDRTNIFIPGKARYYIPDQELPMFFLLLEQVRRDGIALTFAEKQEERSSGILVDVDIFYKPNINESKIDDRLLRDCISILMKTIDEIFDLTPLKQVTDKIEIVITKRDKPVPRDHNGLTVMSEGFHILIPGIKISRAAKHYLLKRIIKTGVFERRVGDALGQYLIEEKYAYLDEASRYVPVFFVGCKRDPKKVPYELHSAYNYYFGSEYTGPSLSENKTINDNNQNCILVNELSLNYEVHETQGGIIKKRDILSYPKYSAEIDAYRSQNRPKDIEDEVKLSGEMSIMSLHDPEFAFIKSLLDILAPFRSQERKYWLSVLSILASISDRLKPLGEYFSRKSPEKFQVGGIAAFESIWNGLVVKSRTLTTGKRQTIGTLIWMAKYDNPKRYDEVMKRNVYKVINTIAYKRSVTGEFEHADIVEVLYHMFSTKYFTDKRPGERKLSWYEFLIPGEQMEKGQVFKYNVDDTPRSLELYVSKILVDIFEKIHSEMFDNRYDINDKQKSTNPAVAVPTAPNGEIINDPEFERRQKRKLEIVKGLLKTIKHLKQDGFISSVVRRAATRFEKRGWSTQMDQDENILGVGNGVLLFHESGQVELLETQHDYKISMFTAVEYHVFDPRKPHTKHLLKALRSMFRDDDPDTHKWFMCALASALTGQKKEPFIIMLLGTGREGKSTVMELWRAVFGQYSVKLLISLLVGERSRSESANPAAMSMENKRAASYQEPDQKDRMNVSAMKETTGGEKQTGRGLFQGQREFEPRCVHFVPTNHLIDINTTDDATWRRIKVIRLQIKFFNPNDSRYEANNPFHRLIDPHADRFAKDQEFLSAFLSILVHYWQILKIEHDGKLVNIPHPHIEFETAKYRTSKDSIDEFITRRLVRVPERQIAGALSAGLGITSKTQHIERMNVIIEKYVMWMDSQAKWCAKSFVESSLENSKIGKMFEQDRVSKYLKGLRFLRPDEPKAIDEEYVFDASFSDILGDDYKADDWNNKREQEHSIAEIKIEAPIATPTKLDNNTKLQMVDEAVKAEMLSDAAKAAIISEKKLQKIEPETVDQYYNRVVAEYDSNILLAPIEQRAQHLDDQENSFVKELLEYDSYKRQKEIKTTAEEGRRFQLESKKAMNAAIQTMTADARIVETIPLPVIESFRADNDNYNNDNSSEAATTKTVSLSDIKMLESDDMF